MHGEVLAGLKCGLICLNACQHSRSPFQVAVERCAGAGKTKRIQPCRDL